MAEQWYYTRGEGQQRIGPIRKDDLKQAAANGQLSPQDLVWRVGMPQWAPATSIPELFGRADGSPAPVGTATAVIDAPAPALAGFTSQPQAQTQQINYYSGPGGLPGRAAKTLSGHARPNGDTNIWPINDQQMAQFQHAFKLRKKITGAANLFRALLLLAILTAAVIVPVALFMFASRRTQGEGIVMLIIGGFMTGMCILYYFLWRATYRSKRWAPLTFFVLCMISVVSSLGQIALGMSTNSPTAAPVAIGGFASILITGAFAWSAWRAYAAIPDYIMQPAWCQEILVGVGL